MTFLWIDSLPRTTRKLFSLLKAKRQSERIYQCPADTLELKIRGRSVLRVRSFSLNGMMGKNSDIGSPWNPHPKIKENIKFTDTIDPGPGKANFFIDEQSDAVPNLCSIDDGYFAVNLTTWDWQNQPATAMAGCFLSPTDMPNNGAGSRRTHALSNGGAVSSPKQKAARATATFDN